MFKKLKNLFLKPQYTYELSPKGRCFKNYLLKILNDNFTERDYIEDYERTLQRGVGYGSMYSYMSRKARALYLLDILNSVESHGHE